MECGISMNFHHGFVSGVFDIFGPGFPQFAMGHGEALEVTTKDCRWHHYNMTAMAWRPVGPVAGHLKLVAIRGINSQRPAKKT
jgi:hypothetical protein